MKNGGNTSVSEGRVFCVSFLKNDTSIDAESKCFISGNVMNEMICHNMRKMKFVYDETIFYNGAWSSTNKKQPCESGMDC